MGVRLGNNYMKYEIEKERTFDVRRPTWQHNQLQSSQLSFFEDQCRFRLM